MVLLLQADKYYAGGRPEDGSVAAASLSTTAPAVERDLKLALGLLLKHRGGEQCSSRQHPVELSPPR